jgi:kelch-like protein 18
VSLGYPGVAVINNLLYVLSMAGELEVYDPVSDRWTARSPVPEAGTINLVAAVNGALYAISGTNQCCSSVGSTVNAYDPATDTWTGKAVLSNLRQLWGVGALNGLLYVLGGVDPYDPVNTFQVYDPSTNKWTAKTVPPQALNWVVGVVVVNAQLYAIADANESYRP